MATFNKCHHFFHGHVLFRKRHIDVWFVTLDIAQRKPDTGINSGYYIFQKGKTPELAFFFTLLAVNWSAQ